MLDETNLVLASHRIAIVAQTLCERLKSLSRPNTSITGAESVAAGPFQAPVQPVRPPDPPVKPVAIMYP